MNKKIFIILLLICSTLTVSCGNNDISADVSLGEASQTVSAEISEEALEESESFEESTPEESITIEESEASLPEESVPPPAGAVTEELGTTEKGFKIFSVDGVVYIEGVLIVNKTYPLPQSYCPNGMTAETHLLKCVRQQRKRVILCFRKTISDPTNCKACFTPAFVTETARSMQIDFLPVPVIRSINREWR